MEKLFKARWWDYHNREFNINGRICLETLIPFGFVGTILLKYVNPLILKSLSPISSTTLNLILCIFIVIITIDAVISFIVIGKFKRTAKEVEKESVKDDTEEISNMVREVTTQKVEEIKSNITESADEALKKIEKIPTAIQLNVKFVREEAHFTSEKIYKNLLYSEQKIIQRRNQVINLLKERVLSSQERLKSSIEYRITTTKEFTDIVKNRFSNTWLDRRVLKAFPDLQVKSNKNDRNVKK